MTLYFFCIPCQAQYFFSLQNYALFWTGLPKGSFFLFFVMCSISPYIAMSSVSDYKVRKGGEGPQSLSSKCCVFPHRKTF